ncbi:STAS domain-containing protein [Dactylosporangium aurantiacum]|uniref:Anti-sigma factor antagonist n=1 Tax=Dactylosporangium aurantiacum TaxID=35754 RepID=A0A9Q9MG85_9ACTN|nr:STAS domain-containing protein [Dactylosporangium aurantiacum]MDG6105786.1 STAS domain-containing protein [Dactylosporangium aurantiacum]UWZ58028.1 STAS domain-containing protein [Dactylosporangium aurantiacum]
MTMRVSVREKDGYSIVTPHGDVFADTFEPLYTAVMALAAGDRPRIVLDLAEVRLCDSSGLGMLFSAHRLVRRREGSLRLVGVQPNVAMVLRITNMDQQLDVRGSVEAATGDWET